MPVIVYEHIVFTALCFKLSRKQIKASEPIYV